MQRILLLLPLLLALLAGAASAAPGEQRTLTKLPNGLSVYIIKDSRFPLVATRLYVRTGSANEDAKQAGIRSRQMKPSRLARCWPNISTFWLTGYASVMPSNFPSCSQGIL